MVSTRGHASTERAHKDFRSKIDYSKYKTKICRHFQLGTCPFEDRCAFSHGDDSSPDMSLEASPRHPRRVKSESTMISVGGDDLQEITSESGSNSECRTVRSPPPPPPPAYEEATNAGYVVVSSPTLYPCNYRNDPYSFDGIRYEN